MIIKIALIMFTQSAVTLLLYYLRVVRGIRIANFDIVVFYAPTATGFGAQCLVLLSGVSRIRPGMRLVIVIGVAVMATMVSLVATMIVALNRWGS